MNIIWVIPIRLVLLSAVSCFGMAGNVTEQERLYEYLLAQYEKQPRHVKDPTKPLKIFFTFELVKVHEVNAKKQRLAISSIVIQEWQDDFLKWNASQYSGFESINISPAADIWLPDIGLYNEIANKDHKKTQITTNVIVVSNGTCRWSIPTFVHTTCSIDVSFFPLDLQQCSLRYGSLTYTTAEVEIQRATLHYPSRNFIKNGEWMLYNVSIKTETVWDISRWNNYTVVEVTLKMKRNTYYYIFEMLIPCFLISCLTILGFILPPESGERMSLGMLTLLAMTFFQQRLMMKVIPLQDFPIISQYFFITILEIVLALFVTTITLKFYHCSDKEMPRFLQIIVLNFLGRITRICGKDDEKEAAQSQLSFTSNGSNTLYDIELTGSDSFTKEEMDEGSNEFRIGFSRDRSLSTKSSNSLKNETDEVKIEENPTGKWKKDWLMAARIVDRFSICMSLVIGLLTAIVIFIRAPLFWESTD